MKIITTQFESSILHFTQDAYFNATEAAAAFGKEAYEWLRLPSTREYIEAVLRHPETLPGKSRYEDFDGLPNVQKYVIGETETDLVLTIRGGTTPGTWLHPDLVVVFARWLSQDFAVWCDRRIKELLTGNYEKAVAESERLRNQIQKHKERIEKQKAQIQELEDDIKDYTIYKDTTEVRIEKMLKERDLLEELNEHYRYAKSEFLKDLRLNVYEDVKYGNELSRVGSAGLNKYVQKLKNKALTLQAIASGILNAYPGQALKANRFDAVMSIADEWCSVCIKNKRAQSDRKFLDEVRKELQPYT